MWNVDCEFEKKQLAPIPKDTKQIFPEQNKNQHNILRRMDQWR